MGAELRGVLASRRDTRAEARAIGGLALIVTPAFVYDINTPFPGMAAIPPVLGTVLLLGSASSVVNRRLLSAPLMRFFGLVSYSLYLWHWPVISLTRMVLVHEPSLTLRLGLVLVSVALAWASYRFIEQPFRRSRAPAAPTLRRYAGAMALVAAVTGSALALQGYPQRWPAGFTDLEAEVEHAVDPCLALSGPTPQLSKPCYTRDPKQHLVAVVGDSHAAALAPGLRALASVNGLAVVQLTKASCPFLQGISRRVRRKPHLMADCAAFDRRVMQLLLHDQRIGTVVIAGAWRGGGERHAAYTPVNGPDAPADVLLERGLTHAVAALQGSGKQVLIVRDVPYIQFLPTKRLAACASPLRAAFNGIHRGKGCNFAIVADVEDDASSLAVLDRVARNTGAALVDPRLALCGSHGCRIALQGHQLYRDQQHLTHAGSVLASGVFAQALGMPAIAAENSTSPAPHAMSAD